MKTGEDKKDYKTVLKALDSEASVASILNKLRHLAIDTEDEKLEGAVSAIANRLSVLVGPKTSQKTHMLQMAKHFEKSDGREQQILAAAILATVKYCQDCIATQEPQWQILAKQAGWKPAD